MANGTYRLAISREILVLLTHSSSNKGVTHLLSPHTRDVNVGHARKAIPLLRRGWIRRSPPKVEPFPGSSVAGHDSAGFSGRKRMETDYIPNLYRLYTGYIPSVFRVYTEYIPNVYRVYTECIPSYNGCMFSECCVIRVFSNRVYTECLVTEMMPIRSIGTAFQLIGGAQR